MAVSCLSPVRIHILMSAFIRVSIVSGTLSWSLSSIAVAPSSCRFYTPQWAKADRRKRSQSGGDHSRGRPLKRQVSEKHVCRDCVTHSAVFFPSSAGLVYHVEKPQRAFRGIGFASVASACVCVHLQTLPLPYKQGRTILSVFFLQENLVVLWAWL